MADTGVLDRGSECQDIRGVLRGIGAGSLVVWVRDMGYIPAHSEDLGLISPQGGPQNYRTVTTYGSGWDMGVYPSG